MNITETCEFYNIIKINNKIKIDFNNIVESNNEIYLIDTNGYLIKINKILFSKYIRTIMKIFFTLFNTFNDEYAVCITYSKGDTQPFITEKCKIGHTPLDNMIRCMEEEIGITLIDKKKYLHIECTENNINNHLYCIDINNTDPFNYNYSVNFDEDDDNTRITIILHGDINELIKKLTTMRDFNTLNNKPNDSIIGYTLVKVSDIKCVCDKIDNYEHNVFIPFCKK